MVDQLSYDKKSAHSLHIESTDKIHDSKESAEDVADLGIASRHKTECDITG